MSVLTNNVIYLNSVFTISYFHAFLFDVACCALRGELGSCSGGRGRIPLAVCAGQWPVKL